MKGLEWLSVKVVESIDPREIPVELVGVWFLKVVNVNANVLGRGMAR